jgi:hypothetical protein
MPCYQSTSLPSGVTTTGRTSYATQADCLQACQEGACCEGTSCSVKPQCQCKCRSNSCCGPDTMTVNGVTGPRCRGGTESECAARGGVWRPCYGCSADAATPDNSICSPGDRPQANAPSFKGVGTTCTPNPCCCPNVATVSVTISNFESYYEFPRLSPNGTWTLSHDSGTCDSWSYSQTLQSYSCPNASTVGGPANPLLNIGISSQGLGLIAADCTQVQATVSDSSFMSKVCSGTSFSGTTESVTSFGRVIYRFSYAVGNPLP